MAATPKASIAPWKRNLIEDLKKKFKEYPAIGILDISGIPARQFQEIRELLRDKAEIKVSRKVLLRIAIEKASEDNPELEELKEYLEGPSALIFSELDPFKLWKLLEENRTTAPAKPGMEAPRDIIIPEGDTEFSPGPIVGELQQAGINARIQAGKVVVLEDSKVVGEGEPIPEEKVGVLSRFGIEPREIGFELRAAYADETVFAGDVLQVNVEETVENIQKAYTNSLTLSFEIKYPTSQNIGMIIGQAPSQAHNLALNASYLTSETSPKILNKAQSQMLNLASVIASKDIEAIGEKLRSKISETESVEEKKEKKKTKEEAEEEAEDKKEEDKEVEEEEESSANLSGLFE
ncbi:hypothetical protein AKJ49_02075 [candidate division MSBL1 archaeon SCGC-AAA382A03]|uniref:Large ribosomal subunit protein uL10 n=1 Tax=candidate division MSBL1 archaeon SCGC-AAA382A03 TaxID=1698278 RepID=A0A133VDF1_9EURY|nr:hypothetical protein AKJ49_02075 [candidate division MSBL1 archaeon SCGC-AAA382A03]